MVVRRSRHCRGGCRGYLAAEVLVVGPRQAALDARWRPGFSATNLAFHQVPVLNDITAVDERGANYALRVNVMSGSGEKSTETAWPIAMRLLLDPVPEREAGWLELRGQNGTAARLLPSTRVAARVDRLRPTAVSPAERELSELALSLITLSSGGDTATVASAVRRRCSVILARSAELQGSGELDAASELPGQLARLCAALTEHRAAEGLPPSWAGMLAAAERRDGPRYHLDLGAALPPVDGVTVLIDSLFSMHDGWRLYLRAAPGWWKYSEDRDRKRAVLSVSPEDDRGGSYISTFGGSTGQQDHEEVTLRFLPRLDPAARALKLTVRGATEEVPVTIGLDVVANSPLT